MQNIDLSKPHVFTFPEDRSGLPSIRAKALVFADPRSRQLLQHIEKVASTKARVLITGEIGTGKELVARHIHKLSGRTGPFLVVDCRLIQAQQAEPELFGIATNLGGDISHRKGWFEAAAGGTLYLDEAGDLPLAVQAQLLRALQEQVVVPVGAKRAVKVDARVITATNYDLDRAEIDGHFRLDLLYPLNTVIVNLPPLRERSGDILILAEYFLGLYSQKLGAGKLKLSNDACDTLLDYPWPANIRELEEVIHRTVRAARGKVIAASDLGLSHLQTAQTQAS